LNTVYYTIRIKDVFAGLSAEELEDWIITRIGKELNAYSPEKGE
jgi:hypothetical protein